MECISTSRPVARKSHWCAWCNEGIVPGEKYYRWSGKFEGEFQSNAMHEVCEKASGRCYEDWRYDGFLPEQKKGMTFAESEDVNREDREKKKTLDKSGNVC